MAVAAGERWRGAVAAAPRPGAARRELEGRLTAQEARALEAEEKAEKDSALLRADLRAMRSHLTTRDLEMRVELSKAVDHAKQLAESLDQERSERSILLRE